MADEEQRLINPESAAPSYAEQSTASFNEAVNTARFVKGFGIAALVYALLSVFGALLGGGIGVGAGLFIMRYDSARYYKVLGIVVILFALIGGVVPFLGSAALSAAILGKGIQVLGVLAKTGHEDEDWHPTRKRALIGTVTSGAGLLISLVLMVLTIIGMFFLKLTNGGRID